MPVSQFPSAAAANFQDVNNLVSAHIAVKMHVVDPVAHYGFDDFSVDMDRLPVKKAVITEYATGYAGATCKHAPAR